MTDREPSLRRAARRRYLAAAQQPTSRPDAASRAAADPTPDLVAFSGREPAGQAGRDRSAPSLTERVRALYQDSVVPVREIARLAGVTERTIYKYARQQGWRPRLARLARGAGGRFIALADQAKPHPRGLKALDPAAAAVAASRCALAGRRSDQAVAAAAAAAQARAARARAARLNRARLAAFASLNRTLATLREIEARGGATTGGAATGGAAARATICTANALLDQIERLRAPPED